MLAELAAREAESTGVERARARLERASLCIDLGRFGAAHRELRRVAAAPELPDALRHATWLLTGELHVRALDQLPDQHRLAEESLRLVLDQAPEGSWPWRQATLRLAALRLEEARRAASPSDRHELLASVVQDLRRVQTPGWRQRGVGLTWGELASLKGWQREASEQAAASASSPDPVVRAHGEWLSGRIAALRGDSEAALEHLGRATAELDRLREGITDWQGDGGFIRAHRAIYREQVRALLAAGRTREALVAAERARARARTPLSTPPIEAVQEHLASDTAILVYFDTGSAVAVWWIRHDELGGTTLPMEVDLALLVRELQDPMVDVVPRLRALHRVLVAPVASAWSAPRTFVVPYGELRRVPFDALAGDDGPLLLRSTISTLPRLGVPAPRQLSSPAEHAPPAPVSDGISLRGPAIALIDPMTDYERPGLPLLPRLPHGGDGFGHFALGLMAGAGSLIPEAATGTTASGARADLARLTAASAGARFVHLACHGEFDRLRPWESSLLLAGGGRDGRLRASRFRDLSLEGVDLIVLAGCRTVLAAGGGDDLAGFPRAFLDSGARCLLGSLWRVEDASTGRFMQAFYRHLGEVGDAPEACRRAKRELWTEEKSASHLSTVRHLGAYHWAGWTILEKGSAP